MSQPKKYILKATWTSPTTGLVSLTKDWKPKGLPPLFWADGKTPLPKLKMDAPLHFGELSGYFSQGEWITFCLCPKNYKNLDLKNKEVYVAGNFNQWNPKIGSSLWRLDSTVIKGKEYYLLDVPINRLFKRSKAQFKFVTSHYEWLELPAETPNVISNEHGNRNFLLDKNVTGHHRFTFKTPSPIDNGGQGIIRWVNNRANEEALMMPGEYIHSIYSHISPGVTKTEEGYLFKVFAPRASKVELKISQNVDMSGSELFELGRLDASVWGILLEGDLHHRYYYYYIHGAAQDAQSSFDPSVSVLDPYAIACVGAEGPAIVVDPDTIQPVKERFQPPNWHDLVICEAHVRDLLQHAPIKLTHEERLGFSGLTKWVRRGDFHLKKLGFNAVELQPVQQFDTLEKEDYGWGYMPVNWFSPSSHYTTSPEEGTQIEEFQDLVKAFHEQGMAVILDVVYNHYGVPNYLQFLDKRYFFELSPEGEYMNWSGCGNTYMSTAPMARKLIIDSLLWFIKTYDIDGFRFDLAELLGKETLIAIETELKKEKPSVILIAEPWSFRGHIAYDLRTTGFASWNDGYREFVRKYICGEGNKEGIHYFLAGSMGHLSSWPAQSVNYVESHDDFCWMDIITENSGHDARNPTIRDRRRTHLVMATLMMSVGIPMLSEGQEMLRSKEGNNNTYLRGDINALRYKRMQRFPVTYAYFRDWIKFRLSGLGSLLRLANKPDWSYFEFYSNTENSAAGILYNADNSKGNQKLLFAINPHGVTTFLEIKGVKDQTVLQIADHERMQIDGLETPIFEFHDDMLELPPFSCGLWILS
jgi:pullulanase/glycogen debranching enzyme